MFKNIEYKISVKRDFQKHSKGCNDCQTSGRLKIIVFVMIAERKSLA
jgi:hypothetical protein